MALLAALAAGCLSAGPGACSDQERAFFNEVRHFDDLVLKAEDHGWGTCHASFTTRADPEAVIAHYQAELRDAGWELVAFHGAETPPPGEGTSIGTVDGWKGNVHYSVEVIQQGSAEVTVSLHVGG